MYAHDRLSFSDAIRVDRQASTSVESTISVVGVFSTLFRHKWKVIASLVAALALALVYLQMARPAYTATASVLIEPADAVTGLSEAFMPLQTADPELSTELEVITARETLGVVVERLDLTADPEFNAALREPPSFDPARLVRTAVAEALALIGTGAPAEDASAPLDETAVPETRAAIDALANRISVDILGTTRIIEISVESYSREKAARIANAISEAYIEGLVSAKIEAQRFATAFYAEQVAELRDDVERSTAALQGFRAENVIVPENSVQTSSLEEFKRDLADIDVRVTSLSRQIDAFERVESGDAAPETLATALEHPSIAALAQEPDFARVRPRVASHVDALREQRQQSMARRDVLQTGLANLQSSLKVAAENRVRHGQLVLEAEASKALFEDFLQQQKRIATQQGIMTPGARVLNHAEPPYYPSSPRKGVVLVIAIALGLQIGCCWVMAIELRKDSFASIDDLERATGLQVLGSIPEDRRVRNGSALVSTVTLEYGGMLAEAVKGIRTSLLGPGGRDTCLVAAVTSSVAEESKSTTSAALAIVTAHIGKRVLVVDADTRRSFIHRIFKVDDSEGLLSVLKGETAFTDAIKRHEASGIDVLPVGASCPATADLLFSSAFPELITKLRDHYDVVVIDCPPVLPIVDTRAVVPCVDSVVYVVRWGDTPKRSVRRGLNILHDMGARVTGLVLTRIKPGGDQKYGYGEYGLYSQTYHSRVG